MLVDIDMKSMDVGGYRHNYEGFLKNRIPNVDK